MSPSEAFSLGRGTGKFLDTGSQHWISTPRWENLYTPLQTLGGGKLAPWIQLDPPSNTPNGTIFTMTVTAPHAPSFSPSQEK
jgi:hypothetical protein